MSSSPTAVLSHRPLLEVFAQVPDPRDPRGVRHPLSIVLTLAQAAVLAGSRTLLAISEWAQDADRDMLSRIGISPDQVLPSESTIRRTLAQVDAHDLDARLAGWMATRVGHLAGRQVIAIDGKTMRGARTATGAPHLVAALDHAAGTVLGQLAVATKSNEIPALRVGSALLLTAFPFFAFAQGTAFLAAGIAGPLSELLGVGHDRTLPAASHGRWLHAPARRHSQGRPETVAEPRPKAPEVPFCPAVPARVGSRSGVEP